MSYNWENVVWQTKDGRWGIGFFDRISYTDSWDNEDYDSEWDDEFDHSVFVHASTGHPTQESAYATWRGANPGHHTVYEYSRGTAKEIAEFEDMARACNDSKYAKERKERLAKEAYKNRRKQVIAHLRSKDNEPRPGMYYLNIAKGSKLNPYDGVQEILTARLEQDGDWLVCQRPVRLKSGKTVYKAYKAWNTKTRLPAPDLASAERQTYGYTYR